MSDTKIPLVINQWQHKLQIKHYQVTCERISPLQVCDDYLQRGHEFVGVCTDHANHTACLYHTRKLQTADIIHELLHVKYPHLTEDQVNRETNRWLLYSRKEVNNIEIL